MKRVTLKEENWHQTKTMRTLFTLFFCNALLTPNWKITANYLS